MRARLRELAAYFGLARPADERARALRPEPARRALTAHACWLFAAAVTAGACVVTVFGWGLADTLAGTALGTAIWGTLYFFGVRDRVPRGTLAEPPPGAVLVVRWERAHGRRALVAADRDLADDLYAIPARRPLPEPGAVLGRG